MAWVRKITGTVTLDDGRQHKFQVTSENWVQWGSDTTEQAGAAVDVLDAVQYALAEHTGVTESDIEE